MQIQILLDHYERPRNKGVMDEVRAFGSDLHSVILSSAKKA